MSAEVTVVPTTADRWDDLAALFEANATCNDCWCMWWRVPGPVFEDGRGAGNRSAMQQLVVGGREPGLLAYADETPVGWVSVGRRPDLGRLPGTRLFKPDDPTDASVWSVVCFYVPRAQRRQGLVPRLLHGAITYARERGARVVEAYPVVPDGQGAAELFPGVPSVYARAGFVEVAAPSPKRRIMRLDL